MSTIHLKLLFSIEAESAAKFYTELFDEGNILQTTHYPMDRSECVACGIDAANAGQVMNVDFRIGETIFTAINGKEGEEYNYTSSATLLLYCGSDEEYGSYVKQLSKNGKLVKKEKRFSLIQDQFGVFWRVTKDTGKQKIKPYFQFPVSTSLEDTLNSYKKIFPNMSIEKVKPNFESEEEFNIEIHNQSVIFAKAKHTKNFTESISFIVMCKNRTDVNFYWEKFSEAADGDGLHRGDSAFLVDNKGIWWQLITQDLSEMMRDTEHLEHSINELNGNEEICTDEIMKRRK
ncbi:VOC family protein [Virgibacillus sp. NKC19-16]|uniref:VOC family protein n=1 Tax=Virgibacillus salidurans TaxID=2831673 RepID=UPI001F2A8938|nr:VOC family protein [Virgibacillus sp. NKC19-16]UJL47109.1 VOC family protein [Virgibacillus sp. NKC19-16]